MKNKRLMFHSKMAVGEGQANYITVILSWRIALFQLLPSYKHIRDAQKKSAEHQWAYQETKKRGNAENKNIGLFVVTEVSIWFVMC